MCSSIIVSRIPLEGSCLLSLENAVLRTDEDGEGPDVQGRSTDGSAKPKDAVFVRQTYACELVSQRADEEHHPGKREHEDWCIEGDAHLTVLA
jgi:hypothetical protein